MDLGKQQGKEVVHVSLIPTISTFTSRSLRYFKIKSEPQWEKKRHFVIEKYFPWYIIWQAITAWIQLCLLIEQDISM